MNIKANNIMNIILFAAGPLVATHQAHAQWWGGGWGGGGCCGCFSCCGCGGWGW